MEREHGGTARDQSRREFAKRIGTALGGVTLLGRNAFAQIPSGYRFYRVLTANDGQVYNNRPNIVGDLTAAVMMGTTHPPGRAPLGYVYFHGTATPGFNPSQPAAAFLINLDYSVTPPKVIFLNVMTFEGDKIPVGETKITVGHLGTGASNSAGTYATTIQIQDLSGKVAPGNTPGVYTWDPNFGTWSKLAGFADPAPDKGTYGANFGDLSIDDSGQVIFAAATTQNPPNEPSYIGSDVLSLTTAQPGASSHRRHRMLLRSGVDLPGSLAPIRGLGLVELSRDGWFVAQASAAPAISRRAARLRDRRLGTALIRGKVTEPDSIELLAISPHLINHRVQRRVTQGDIILGPRIGVGGNTAYVAHSAALEPGAGHDNDHQLIVENSITRRKHTLSATGLLRGNASVMGISPAVLGDTGVVYHAENLSDGTTQLVISDPASSASEVLLRSGDTVGGKQITEILFGYHPTQVDTEGRLAFAAEFMKDSNGNPMDPNNIESSIVVGIPS